VGASRLWQGRINKCGALFGKMCGGPPPPPYTVESRIESKMAISLDHFHLDY